MEALIAFLVTLLVLFMAASPVALILAIMAFRDTRRLRRELEQYKDEAWIRESKRSAAPEVLREGTERAEGQPRSYPLPGAAAKAASQLPAPLRVSPPVPVPEPSLAAMPTAQVSMGAPPSEALPEAPPPVEASALVFESEPSKSDGRAAPAEDTLKAASSETPPESTSAEQRPSSGPSGDPGTSPPRPQPVRPVSLESIGVWVVSVAGGLALLIGAVLAFRIAIERGFVGPSVRYAGGLFFGSAALLLSEVLWSRRYRLPSAAVAGGGIGALYAALYAGHSLYGLVGMPLTFGLMVATTLVGVLLAVRRDSQFVAILGLAGGFLTPVLLSTGSNHGMALFAYVALLDLGLLLAAAFRGWWVVAALAAPATLAIHFSWAARYGQADQAGVGVVSALLFIGLFLAFSLPSKVPRLVGWLAFAGACLMPFAAMPFLGQSITVGRGPSSTMDSPTLALAFLLLSSLSFQVIVRLRSSTLAALASGLAIVPGYLLFIGSWLHGSGDQPVAAVFAGLVLVALLPWVVQLIAPRTEGSYKVEEPWRTMPGIAEALLSLSMLGLGTLPFVSASLEPGWKFALASLLVIVTWWMSVRPGPGWLSLLGLGGVLLCTGAMMEGASSHPGTESFVLLGSFGFVLVYLLVPFLLRGLDSTRHSVEGVLPWLGSALAGPLLFLPLRWAWISLYTDDLIGLLPLSLGACTLAAALIVREKLGQAGEGRLVLYIAVSLLFASVAVPLQLSNEWLTVGWAIEGAALAWLSLRMRHPGIVLLSLSLFALVGVRLVLNPAVLEYHPVASTSLLNWTLYGYGVPTLALLCAAWLRTQPEPARGAAWEWFRHLPRAYVLLSIAVIFVLLNLEVSYLFAHGTELGLSGNTLAAAMTRSISWAAFGLVLLGLGWSPLRRWLRPLALLFLVLASLKVFLMDLWHLSGLMRVGSLFGVAIVLILAAIGFQRLILRSQDQEDSR